MSEKEHSGTSKDPSLFPKNWQQVEYFEIKDASRLCSLIALRNMSGKLPDSTTFSVRE